MLITPSPGFVIKSATVAAGYYLGSTPVPPHSKTFINVLFHSAIPQPPAARLGPDAEQRLLDRTMNGDAVDDDEQLYVVPVVVSDGTPATDKAGNPSIVFDAILHPSLKPRLHDINVKSFVLEIILSHIESPPTAPGTRPPRSLSLSRTLATPNIRYKGTLQARDVQLPDIGAAAAAAANTSTASSAPRKPLIEELPDAPLPDAPLPDAPLPDAPPPPQPTEPTAPLDPHTITPHDTTLETPTWQWSHDDAPTRSLTIDLPKFTRPHHAHTTLTLSPSILTLRTPTYFLQIIHESPAQPQDLNVQQARAEWHVADGSLVVYC